MKKLNLLSLFCTLALLILVSSASADTLYFYGGDFDENNVNANALSNETDSTVSGNPYGAAVFQNFTVTGSSVIVTGLFSNDLMILNPSTAYYEIRSNVSVGDGGTLIASGTVTDNVTATGRTGFGVTEYTNLVSGLSIDLSPGQYWFTVVPIDLNTAGGRSFNSNTFGLNAIGTQTSDLQYWDSNFSVDTFVNANGNGVFQTFSSGVYVADSAVPEPATMLLFGTGLAGLAAVRRKR